VKILEHPASVARLGPVSTSFTQNLASLVGAIRTSVITTMVQTEVTIRNALMNLDGYMLALDSPSGGIADLERLCAGRPAVLVAAGPSLARTIGALQTPCLRDRCVIIAVQTALKPLLEAGIKPHFVTALDYHAISTRFYEGLTAQDVEGITLIAEPKVNPSVPMAWPGAIRCPHDATLDRLLDIEESVHGSVPAGATVAHLNYYLARHMGCDPVILTGQDLGFTDGQYYASGASIHNVWACELNPFTTLEMLEWERIVRNRPILRRTHDHLGREIYTDEQMSAYQAQFEREFVGDNARGLTTIDATEGGTAKAHTTPMALEEALNEHAAPDAPALAEIPSAPRRGGSIGSTLQEIKGRLDAVRKDVVRLSSLSRTSQKLLEKANETPGDEARLKPLIDEVYKCRDQAHELQPAFDLVQRLNQTGAFNRSRADRVLKLRMASNPAMDEREVRSHQLERDITNVSWLADAGDTLARMLIDAQNAIDGHSKPTEIPSHTLETGSPRSRSARKQVGCVILDEGDHDQLARVIARVRDIEGVDSIHVLTASDVALPSGVERHVVDVDRVRGRLERVRKVRRFSTHSWRTGVGNLTCFDEVLSPEEATRALGSSGLDAALVLGSGWTDLDASVCERIIARYRDNPQQHRVVFAQTHPGRSGVLLDAGVIDDLAAASRQGGPFSNVGGLLRYNPMHPNADPIAKPNCVEITPEQRDWPWSLGDDELRPIAGAVPQHLIVELTSRRSSTGGVRDGWLAGSSGDSTLADTTRVLAMLDELASARDDSCVTFAGAGDPLLHPELWRLLKHARSLGVATHVRTDLLSDDETYDSLVSSLPDVLSVDVLALDERMHRHITGSESWEMLTQRLESLWNHICETPEHERSWLVARMTRCDEVYEQIERFYDFWVAHTGCAVIDPLPSVQGGQRIAPLALPRVASRALRATTLCVRGDGFVCEEVNDFCKGPVIHTDPLPSLPSLWASALRTRFPGSS
ncbi:MAG: 6-hydroxymethylpterin diphosphokinase MptE-like protein, partial [Planctomycetota bacterium]|jgi:hypothetical protein